MVTAYPGQVFTAIVDGAPTGLTGTLEVRIEDDTAATVFGPTTAGIVELGPATGTYTKNDLVAPAVGGDYFIVWDAAGTAATEELVVSGIAGGGTGGGTTFLELRQNVMGNRFDASQDAQIGRWINLIYQRIWDAEDNWLFKQGLPFPFTVAAGGAASGLPLDLDGVIAVYDDNGIELVDLTPKTFDDVRLPNLALSRRGKPEAYKVVNRGLQFAPVSDATYTFKLTYRRRVYHYDAANSAVPGLMVADGDYPAWDAEHHDILELGATALGLRMEQDPSSESLRAEYDEALGVMRAALVQEEIGGLQYGTQYSY